MAFLSLFAGGRSQNAATSAPESGIVAVGGQSGQSRAEPVFLARRPPGGELPANVRMPSVLGAQPQTFARGREVAALLLWTFAIFLSLALASYAGDPSASSVAGAVPD